ncbi:uncharacterized protein [Atheta coriaria]|uniref:uncharacterized protein n=1 Tax=Dalotia coriaria TaxID=877792 RepID=UPI0031F3536E
MAKIFYALVVLAVCQYAAATEETAKASAIIHSNAPAFISNILHTVENVAQTLPSADRIDKLIQLVQEAIERIIRQGGPLKEIALKIQKYAQFMTRDVIEAMIAAAKETIAKDMATPEAASIIQAANGIAAEVTESVQQVADVAQEVVDTAAVISEAI